MSRGMQIWCRGDIFLSFPGFHLLAASSLQWLPPECGQGRGDHAALGSWLYWEICWKRKGGLRQVERWGHHQNEVSGSSMGFSMSVFAPLVGNVSFSTHRDFQDNGSVLCVVSFCHVLSRKCCRDAGLKNIKSSSCRHSTPSPMMRSQFGLWCTSASCSFESKLFLHSSTGRERRENIRPGPVVWCGRYKWKREQWTHWLFREFCNCRAVSGDGRHGKNISHCSNCLTLSR